MENRPTPEALRTEFQALLQQIDSFRSKISDRSLSGKNRQKRFKDEVGVDPKELKAYYDQLKKFRAGIEGCISAGKRAYGLSRCTWKGWQSFQSYVWLSVIAFNLNILAEALLK